MKDQMKTNKCPHIFFPTVHGHLRAQIQDWALYSITARVDEWWHEQELLRPLMDQTNQLHFNLSYVLEKFWKRLTKEVLKTIKHNHSYSLRFFFFFLKEPISSLIIPPYRMSWIPPTGHAANHALQVQIVPDRRNILKSFNFLFSFIFQHDQSSAIILPCKVK